MNTLKNNKIIQFILRIDLDPNSKINFEEIAKLLRSEYKAFKTETVHNTNIDVITNEITKNDFYKFSLIDDGISLKVDSFEKAFILEAAHYIDSSIYESKLVRIIDVLKHSTENETFARRIGMRFINVFPCNKILDIGKIFNVPEAHSIKMSLNKPNVSRIITVSESQEDGYRIRVQFGVPNKYYPALISNYDLLLDIDVYSDGLQIVDDWEEIVRSFNHAAFDRFIEYTKESYRQQMQ